MSNKREYEIPEGYEARIDGNKVIIVPKESEDERIKRWIIEYIQEILDVDGFCEGHKTMAKNAIVWLKKQGEHARFIEAIQVGDQVTKNEDGVLVNLSQLKRVAKKDEKQGEQKSTDKVEPKFEIEEGEWYICIRDLLDNYANRAFCKGYIYLSTQNGSLIPSNSNVPFKIVCPDTYFRHWTIEDAKDGDVLCTKNKYPFIYDKGRYNNGLAYYYAGIDVSGNLNIKSPHNMLAHFGRLDNIRPATQEQRDLLFAKMKEAGYEWDADKKESKKIEQKPAEFDDTNAKRMFIKALERVEEQNNKGYKLTDCDKNSWWEDFKAYTSCIVEQKPAEWSEEIEAAISLLKHIAEEQEKDYCPHNANDLRKAAQYLKSLRPHSQWKPSEEQMKALKEAVDEHFDIDGGALWHLYEDLKKLMEEDV